MSDPNPSDRGSAWVCAQFALFAAILFCPSALPQTARPLRVVGAILAAVSLPILAIGARQLGKNLTPFPKPVEHGALVALGLYRWIRHPLYLGVILLGLAIACWKRSAPSALFAGALAFLLDAKANREEEWLLAKYPDYAEYRRRTKKLIPFLF